LVSDADAKRSLVVEIQEPSAGGGMRGTVTVVELDGATRTRQLKPPVAQKPSTVVTHRHRDARPDAMLVSPSPSRSPLRNRCRRRLRQARQPPHFRRGPPPEPFRISFGLSLATLLQQAPEPRSARALRRRSSSIQATRWRRFGAYRSRTSSGAGWMLVRCANFAFTLPTLDACR